MFDIGAPELLVVVIVAILVIGPKDMPLALRAAGRWIGKIRRVSGHFKSGVEAMIRDAELEDMDQKWREQNEKIMAAHPGEMMPLKPGPETGQEAIEAAAEKPDGDEPAHPAPASASASAPTSPPAPPKALSDEPTLPLDGPSDEPSDGPSDGLGSPP